jgi:hypothetical protein
MKSIKLKSFIIAAAGLLVAVAASTPAQATCRSFSGDAFYKGRFKPGLISYLRRKATFESQQKARYYFQSRKPSWHTAKNRRVIKDKTVPYAYRYIATATYCMPGKISPRYVPKYKLPSGVYRKKP